MTLPTAVSPVQLHDRVDVEDFVNGTNLLSGAGGAALEAQAQLVDTVAEGFPVRWMPIETLADDALVASVFFAGATDPASWRDRSSNEERLHLTREVSRPLERALELLEGRIGRRCDALVAIEIGGSNTAAAVDVAARTGRIAVDGDYAGRAVPAFDCITPALYSTVQGPAALVDYYGDEVEVATVANLSMFERLCKMIAIGTLGRVGTAALVYSAADARRFIVGGTLTRALTAGRALRVAREHGGDVVQRVVAGLGGARSIFLGRLDESDWDASSGYMTGYHTITGTGAYSGRVLRVYFQNENHLAWLDGQPVAMSPDVIEVVDAATCEPMVNSHITQGADVAVFVLRRPPRLDTPEGIAALGPARWGFDLPFVGIEALA